MRSDQIDLAPPNPLQLSQPPNRFLRPLLVQVYTSLPFPVAINPRRNLLLARQQPLVVEGIAA